MGDPQDANFIQQVGVEGACEDNICKPFYVSIIRDVILDDEFVSMHLRVMFPHRNKYLSMPC